MPDDSIGNTEAMEKRENDNYLVIETTPFTVVKRQDTKMWYVMMGKYQLTLGITSFEEAEREALAITWDRILQIAIIVAEDTYNLKQK